MINIGYERSPVNTVNYNDGMTRTFGNPPEFDDPKELKMLKDWHKEEELNEMWMYLTHEDYRGLTPEMAEFVMREFHRGYI